MSLQVTQEKINSKEELINNKQRYGIKGKQLLEADNIHEVRSLIGAGNKNLIINGNFDIWQRGTSFSTNNVYTADRWNFRFQGSGLVTKHAEGLRLEKPLGVNQWAFVGQIFESDNTRHLNGKTITISAKVKGETINKIRFVFGVEPVYDDWHAITSPDYLFESEPFTISTSEFTEISYTIQLPQLSTDFTLACTIDLRDSFSTTDGDAVIIKSVQLEEGSVATEFEHRHIGTEIELCQRYYQKSYDLDTNPGTIANNGRIMELATRNSANNTPGVQFLTTMRDVPTISIYSPITGAINKIHNNSDKSLTLDSVGESGIAGISGIPAGDTSFGAKYHYTADAEL